LRKFLSEPLAHFALVGVALFVLYQAVSPNVSSTRTIVVTEQTIATLAQRHAAVWMRPPTAAELRALVDAHIRDEILYREGVAMGFNRDDEVIKRRVLQKLEVFSEETSALGPPTDVELNAYLQENAASYATPPIVDFQQVMFDPARRGAGLEADIDAAMTKLRDGADPHTLGDSTLLPIRSIAVSRVRLAREFGSEFAEDVVALPVGSWQGPIGSGFGVHIVRIDNRIEEQAAKLADVRALVERDWEHERRTKSGEAFYQNLLKDYDVRIVSPLPDETSGSPAQ
jgi:hypothetical protein